MVVIRENECSNMGMTKGNMDGGTRTDTTTPGTSPSRQGGGHNTTNRESSTSVGSNTSVTKTRFFSFAAGAGAGGGAAAVLPRASSFPLDKSSNNSSDRSVSSLSSKSSGDKAEDDHTMTTTGSPSNDSTSRTAFRSPTDSSTSDDSMTPARSVVLSPSQSPREMRVYSASSMVTPEEYHRRSPRMSSSRQAKIRTYYQDTPETQVTSPTYSTSEAIQRSYPNGNSKMDIIRSDLNVKFGGADEGSKGVVPEPKVSSSSSNQGKMKCKRSTCFLWGVVICLVLVAVILTVVFLTVGKDVWGILDSSGDPDRADFVPVSPVAPTPPLASPVQAPSTNTGVPAPVAPIFQPVTPTRQPDEPVAPVPPTPAPTAPTLAPVVPTLAPTGTPTSSPTKTPTTSPTANPTASPTAAPTVDLRTELLDFLFTQNVFVSDQDRANPSSLAATWMAEEARVNGQESMLTSDPEKVVQRFALLTLDFGLQGAVPEQENDTNNDDATGTFLDPFAGSGRRRRRHHRRRTQEQSYVPGVSPILAQANMDECSWPDVTCIDNRVTELRLGSKALPGTIPSELGYLTNLKGLDISQNQLQGSIPESLYGILSLERLFLYQNQLSGSISPNIGNLWNLTHIHLSHNELTGSIPETMASDATIRPYYYINFYRNQMTGTIPQSLRWRQLFYFDLGHNQFSGTLPVDLGEKFVRLRHLHLDHNNFVGTLPESYITVGNGRLEQLTINDNQLTGAVPDNHEFYWFLVTFNLQNNNFDEWLDGGTCRLTVFTGGENVELNADCDICSCRNSFVCDNC